MLRYTEQQEAEQRQERERLKVGDRVAIVDERNCIAIRTVKKRTPKRIFVGSDVYELDSGRRRGSSHDMLRGFPTAEELEAAAQRIVATQEADAAAKREDEKLYAKWLELESLIAPLNATLYGSEISDRWVVDNLTEDAVRLIGTALRLHAASHS